MEFRKYQHVERYGSTTVKGIDEGLCYVFPKIDGTNASVWLDDGELQAGSRKRHLSAEQDNAGFYEWASKNEKLKLFLLNNPSWRVYGEWLVPHSLKTYDDNAWRQFYIFDIIDGDSDMHLPYNVYQPILEEYGLEYIPPLFTVKNPTYDTLTNMLRKNTYLIKDGEGEGEGIVVKNYNFVNRYGKQVWAKIVTNEFKARHKKAMGATEVKEKGLVEQKIVDKYVTKALCEKEYSKIVNESGWESKFIPRLLNTVFYCLITEEAWNFAKEFKFPMVDFRRLNKLTARKVKELLPEAF